MHERSFEDDPRNNPFSDQYRNPYRSPSRGAEAAGAAGLVDQETRRWAVALHLSQFVGILVPFGGFIVPVLIWQLKRDELPGIDAHGREVVNWFLSETIYLFVFALLSLAVIGLPFLIATFVIGVVFPVIGAVKAGDGQVWRYPLAFRFF